MDSTRVDRWLWAARLAKTRSAASALCKGGHVEVNGRPAKPSTPVTVGDRVTARIHRRDRVAVVQRVIDTRVGAAIAADCYDDHSPIEPTGDAGFDHGPVARRDPGAGRPTKRDRRRLDEWRERNR
jgi:ribosome-associated heat shock protein Hsp15